MPIRSIASKLLRFPAAFLFFSALPPLALSPSARAASERPNILLILVDDMSYYGLSCYGDKPWQTPHIDRLAAEGLRFTDAYAYPVCSPTRAALLTGRSTARTDITNWIPGWADRTENAPLVERPFQHRLPLSEYTIAEALTHAGYDTAIDGISLAPILLGQESDPLARTLYWHYPHYNRSLYGEPSSALREGPWKLIHRYAAKGPELYHLEQDIAELNNLAAKRPDVVEDLFAKLQRWRRENSLLPLPPNPNYDPSKPTLWNGVAQQTR